MADLMHNAGTALPEHVIAEILTRLRRGVESHSQIAADLGLARHTVSRYARLNGMKVRQRGDFLPKPGRRGDDSWMEKAKCRGVYRFTEKPHEEQQGWCVGCPVRFECLEFGLAGPTPTVTWSKNETGPVHGGVVPQQLRKLRKLKREVAAA